MGPLGRRAPENWKHYERFGLTAETVPEVPTPVVIGVNWYSNFDTPVWKNGRWFIGLGNLGSIRGGHCVALESGDQLDANGNIVRHLQDADSWWTFYDQGSEGACVGFGTSRMASLLNRKRYFARWLWDRAKERDPWAETKPGDDNGTSVDAAMQVMHDAGHVVWSDKYTDINTDGQGSDAYPRSGLTPVLGEGISVYRWARTVDEVRAVLKSPANDRVGAVRVLNSWGKSYPHRVWLPYETLQGLINDDGEVALVTDR